jgi:threonylcarbamoyladenosine tRNA methylthiotransferase MtaB
MAAPPDIHTGPGDTAPGSTGPGTSGPQAARSGRTVAFRTIGCKLNQCETAQMQETLLARGYRLVGWDSPADIRVVNTCTVTAKSDRTCRHEIRLAKRLDPASTVVVTGCYAQIDPRAVAAIPGVDLVLGNLDKLRLADRLADRLAAIRPANGGGAAHDPAGAATDRPTLVVSPYPEHPEFEGEFFSHFYGYTRAFLKVQTGCDSRCAYCVIPLARGPARSMPKADVLREVDLLAERGFREVVLTGINLGSWGRDSGEGSVADLLEALLERDDTAVPGWTGSRQGTIGRYRLSSIEPLEVDEALLEIVARAGDRVAHHFHLPLQSGSDSVLRRMDRPYTAAKYLAVVSALARRFPGAAIGADVIAGFPGETEAEFQETLALIEHAPLTYLHVFSYSDRPGTKASAMLPKVPPEIVHERSLRLRTLGEHKNASFCSAVGGSDQRVLVLKERDAAGRLVGITGNYVEVLLDGDDGWMNRFAKVRLAEPGDDGRWTATLLGIEGAAAPGYGERRAAVPGAAPEGAAVSAPDQRGLA